MRHRVEVIASEYLVKTVSAKGDASGSGQVYVPKHWVGNNVFVLWDAELVKEKPTEMGAKVLAEAVNFDHRLATKQGTAGGLYAKSDYVGKTCIILLEPTRFKWRRNRKATLST